MKIESILNFIGLKNRTITRADGEKYLTRYYIFRKPFNWVPSIYIHCFHSSDKDLELHDHPWSRSLSLILKGSYFEEYREGEKVKDRVLNPGDFNYIQGNKFHRVDLLTPNVWTLFISGPKVKSWGFWDRKTGEYLPWQEHEKKKSLQELKQPKINGKHFKSNWNVF